MTNTICCCPPENTGTMVKTIWWTDRDKEKIYRASVDAVGNARDVVEVMSDLTEPFGIFVDPVDRKIYWTERGTSLSIKKANFDGTNVQTIINGLASPRGIAGDGTNDSAPMNVYFTDDTSYPSGTGQVERVLVVGGPSTNLITNATGIQNHQIAVDTAGGKMYWVSYGNNTIRRANLDGTSEETLYDTTNGLPGNGHLTSLAINPAAGDLVIVDRDNQGIDSGIYKGKMDGTTTTLTEIVDEGTSTKPFGITWDTSSEQIYWTEFEGDLIKTANDDGSNERTWIDLVSVFGAGNYTPTMITFAEVSPGC